MSCDLIYEVARLWRSIRDYRISPSLLLATLWRLNPGKIAQEKPAAPRNILVIRLDALGDVVMTTPLFRALKLSYPEAKITAIVQAGNRDLLSQNPYIDCLKHPPAVGKSRFFQRLRRELSIIKLYRTDLRHQIFDIAIQPRLGPDYYEANLLLKLVSAPFSIRYEDDSPKGLAPLLLKAAFPLGINMRKPPPQHEVATNLDIARRLSGERIGSAPELFLTEEDRQYASRVLAGVSSKYVVLSVAFGAQAKKRMWPLELWVETIGLLASSRTLFVLLVCSRGEMKEAAYLKDMLNSAFPGVEVSLVSGARLRESAACLEASDLFIGSDSGPAHLAAAVQCPTLVISPHPLSGDKGHANSPIRFRPWSAMGVVLQPDAATAPCNSSCEHLRPHCILRITAAEVAAAADRILAREDHRRSVSARLSQTETYSDSTI